jgi:hypothetical protein
VFPSIDIGSIRFDKPEYLWLLAVPALLGCGCVWRVLRGRSHARRFSARHRTPAQGPVAATGGWLAWLPVPAAVGLLVVGAAAPQAVVSVIHRGAVDIVVLQDGSASMHVSDVRPNRWLRSMRFVRVLADSLQWGNGDRIALVCFAHVAAPQVRLTTDPNTLFFFLDHLRAPPFPLEDDATWDTNIERGIYWGVRLVDKDSELYGPSRNGQVFVLISDGQAWSGQIASALKLASARQIPVLVIGVGTPSGGFIPEAPQTNGTRRTILSPIRAVLDRQSLFEIASAGGGRYFELDRQGDREIAAAIVDAARRRARAGTAEPIEEDLSWYCVLAAAIFAACSVLLVRERAELMLHAVSCGATVAIVWLLTR